MEGFWSGDASGRWMERLEGAVPAAVIAVVGVTSAAVLLAALSIAGALPSDPAVAGLLGGVVAAISTAAVVVERSGDTSAGPDGSRPYRDLVENSPAPINMFDADGTIVWANEAMWDLLALPSDEPLEGRSIFEFLTAESARIAREEIADLQTEDAEVGPTSFTIDRADGTTGDVRVRTTTGTYDGDQVLQAVVLDVTPLQRMRDALAANVERYQTLVEMSPNPVIVHRDGTIVFANEAMADLMDEPSVEDVVGTHITEYLLPEEHDDARSTARRTQAGEAEPTSHDRVGRTASGDIRHIQTTSQSIDYAGDPAVLTIVQDVTERHRHEQTLRLLHDRAQDMVRAPDASAMYRSAVDAATTVRDLDVAAFYAFDGDSLEHVETSEGDSDAPDVLSRDALWSAFTDDEPRVVPLDESEAGETGFLIPVGNHGVLGVVSRVDADDTSRHWDAVHLIAKTLEASLDRAASVADIRERDRRLRRQNRSLEQLTRLEEIIRGSIGSLVEATTEREVEADVCERFADAEKYAFAWVAHDPEAGVRHWSGVDPEYADRLADLAGAAPLSSLIADAFDTASVSVVDDVLEDPDWADLRRDALVQGFRSIAVVPIVRDDHVESALVLHGTEPGLFDDRERTVLDELGRTIGFALEHVAEGTAIGSERRVAVGLDVADPRLFTCRLTADHDLSLSYVGAVPADGEGLRLFVRISAAASEDSDVVDHLESLELVREARVLSAESSPPLCQLTIGASPLFAILQAHDAQIAHLEARDGVTGLRLVLTGDASVRDLVEDLSETYPDTELVERRSDPEPVETAGTVRNDLLDRLTEKQRHALETAYYGGFFEWPRLATSEELAATRDIASSTFQHHLREAERKLLEAVLATDTPQQEQ